MTAAALTSTAGTDDSNVDGWSAQTLSDDDALAAVAAEWDDLHSRCSVATPFGTHAWLESWWRSYGRKGALVVVLVRRGGRLVAAAALTRRRRAGFRVLTPVGAGISDVGDVLLDDSCAVAAARQLARELADLAGWDVIDLPEVPPDAAAWRLVEAWPRRNWSLPGSMCLELDVRPMEDLIARLPPSTARERRRKSRKIDAAGIEMSAAASDEAAAGVRALLALHRQQWRGRGMNPQHARPAFAAHLAGAMPTMIERGHAVLTRYRSDGTLLAVDLVMVGPRAICGYLYGVHPELRRRVDVTQLLLGKNLQLADRLGRPILSMLRGDEPHKRRWRPREVPHQRILLSGTGHRRAALYAVAVRARGVVARVVRSRLPGVRKAIGHVRTCTPSCT